MAEVQQMELTGPMELLLTDGSVVRIQPGPYGKGVSVVPVSLKKPTTGVGSGKRGRKPRPSTVKLRKKLDRDANRGAIKPAPEYVRWLTSEDDTISLAVARQVVYRERRAALDRYAGN